MKKIIKIFVLILALFCSIKLTHSFFTTSTNVTDIFKTKGYVFKINANDKYYLSVAGTPDYYQVTESGILYQVMEIEVLPYASLEFVFFRNEGFDDKIKGMTNCTEFEESVQVKVL